MLLRQPLSDRIGKTSMERKLIVSSKYAHTRTPLTDYGDDEVDSLKLLLDEDNVARVAVTQYDLGQLLKGHQKMKQEVEEDTDAD